MTSMTSLPLPGAQTLDPMDPEPQPRLDTDGLSAVLAEVTAPGCARVTEHLADPMAVDTRTTYAAWLRRQASAWGELRLPAVPVAALDWPLASVRPQCLDVVGLIIADLRELSPRMRPTVVPAQATSMELPQPGVIVAATDLCVRLAVAPARLLPGAQALSAGMTQVGPATRYLTRCAELAGRHAGLAREIDQWAHTAEPGQPELAVRTAQHLVDQLAKALDARIRRGW